MRKTLTKALAGLMLGCALWAAAPLAYAGEVIITYKDGRTIRGERVSEDNNTIVISVATIKTPISKKDVANIKDILSVDDEYKQRKATLKSEDYETWYGLCFWLYQQKAYEKALNEINAFLAVHKKTSDPNNPVNSYVDRANIMKGQVTLELDKIRAESGPNKSSTAKPGGSSTTQPAATASPTDVIALQNKYKDQRLTDAQINMIRVWEIPNPAESKPRVTVKREAIDALINNYRDKIPELQSKANFDKLRAAEGWAQLSIMFDVKARELYPSATIHDDPDTLLNFKRHIHLTYVLNYCGTSNCHGGAEAGNLFLFNIEPTTNRTVYTNFFNLYTWTDANGFMINLDNPQDSYLIQYGQPNDPRNANFLAKKPHPPVKNWAPKFRVIDDPLQRSLTQWIQSLGNYRYDYGIDYTPPVVSPGARPAMRTYGASSAPVPATQPSKPADGKSNEPKKAQPR